MRNEFSLDPRTKIYMMFLISFLTMSTATTTLSLTLRVVITIVPILLLIVEGKVKTAIRFTIFYILGILVMHFFINNGEGFISALALGYCSVMLQFFPSAIMAWYTVRTTKVNEFMAALNKLHCPKGLAISLAVVLRFFPTIKVEYGNIRDAMKMRGISLAGGNLIKMIEYRIIPLLFSCVSIGDELSAAAITRGLGAPGTRSNICEIGFKRFDYVAFVVFTTLTIGYIWGL
ncbi:cobalt transport protein [Gemella bergeri ATCC 700627]|uniref:Cobalt transport protein n=1 Tax=Gemella bergeri ATCC 700627 TaxID=1321820 RepID=U2RV86_9BACL|nr:energy-coupling factor transporter transmembrane component T [Gemella bergeri]ERK57458.1 cobalt transport protein [Gemella bergeri ATCC 700627]